DKTSPYQFYQFWYNTEDEKVLDYLRLFTDLSLEEIKEIRSDFDKSQESREAQRILASEVTKIVHGVEAATAAASVSELLFGNKNITDLSESELTMLQANAPICEVEVGQPLIEVMVEGELATSKREARTFIESG